MSDLEKKWIIAVYTQQENDFWTNAAVYDLKTSAKKHNLKAVEIEKPVVTACLMNGDMQGSPGRPEIRKLTAVLFDTEEAAHGFYGWLQKEFPRFESATDPNGPKPLGMSPETFKKIQFITPASMEQQVGPTPIENSPALEEPK